MTLEEDIKQTLKFAVGDICGHETGWKDYADSYVESFMKIIKTETDKAYNMGISVGINQKGQR